MKAGAPKAEAMALRERRLGREIVFDKADTAEREGLAPVRLDADAMQGGDAIWHQAFAAGFVERRLSPIYENNAETLLAGGQSGGKAGGTAADHDDVGFGDRLADAHHWSSTISEQKPGPIASSRPCVPGAGG